MRELYRRTGRVLQWGLLGLFFALLVPIGFSAARKLATTGQSGTLLTREESGFRVRVAGAASAAGLKAGDLLLLVDGTEARTLAEPLRALEEGDFGNSTVPLANGCM